MAAPGQKLSLLLSLIRNSASRGTGTQEMEKRVQEAVSALESFTRSTEHLLSSRAKAAQRGLEADVVYYPKQYWLTEDKIASCVSPVRPARRPVCCQGRYHLLPKNKQIPFPDPTFTCYGRLVDCYPEKGRLKNLCRYPLFESLTYQRSSGAVRQLC